MIRPLRVKPRRRSRRHGSVVGGALGLVALCAPARGVDPALGPVDRAHTSAAANLEDEPVRYRQPPSDGALGEGSRSASPTTDSVGELSHVALALLVVIAIIFGLRAVARRLALVPTVGRSGRGVRLLSRTVLSPKQQVLLLQVGRRVVVVGDAGAAGMRPLCEITDPDEVASLIGDARAAEASVPATRSFSSLFRRATEPFEGGTADRDTPAIAPAAPPDVPSDVVGLLAKVRGLRQQFDR